MLNKLSNTIVSNDSQMDESQFLALCLLLDKLNRTESKLILGEDDHENYETFI